MKQIAWLFCMAFIGLVHAEETCDDKPDVSSDCGCGASTNRDTFDNDSIVPDNPNELLPIYERLMQAKRNKQLLVPKENKLLHIPGGTFTMGTDDPKIPLDGEMPARPVQVSPFLLQQYEVSNAEFAEFVLETKYQTEAEFYGWSFCFENSLSEQVQSKIEQMVEAVPWWLPVEHASWLRPGGFDTDVIRDNLLHHPVVHVSHNDATAYCKWKGLRLPREAEFERASRGGIDNMMFPWGTELTPDGKHRANLWQGKFPFENTAEDGFINSAPVDSFGEQNQYKLYNIIGNVWEWVVDAWTVQHTKKLLVDPQVEIQGRIDDPTVERVKKGGSYMCHISYCYRYRTASRSSNTADSSTQNIGFRCAGDEDEE